MGYGSKDNGLRRKEAVGMEELVNDFIRDMKIASGINKLRAAEAWNTVSGASRYTLDVFLDKGVLYVTLNSSMARNQLYFQKDTLLARINELLEADSLFIRKPGCPALRNIVLK